MRLLLLAVLTIAPAHTGGAQAEAAVEPSARSAVCVYFDADATDGGDGSASAPYRSLNQATPASDTTWRLRGTFFDERIVGSGLVRFSVEPWPGDKARPILDNRRRTRSVRWKRDIAANVYHTETGEGAAALSAVLYRYAEAVNANGHYFGFLARSQAATVDAARSELSALPGRWWFDGAGTLYVSPPPQALGAVPTDPAEDGAYCFVRGLPTVGAMSNIELHSASLCRIEGLELRLGLNAQNDAYGVFVDSGYGNVVRDCVAYDTGRHGFGFVGYAGNQNNVFDSCLASGAWDVRAGWSAFVFYSHDTDILGARCMNCRAELRYSLGSDGLNAQTRDGIVSQAPQGFLAHTSGATCVRDLEWSDCVAVGYAQTPHTEPFAPLSAGPAPGEAARYDWRAYPARVVRCRLVNGASFGTLAANTAFERCVFDSPRAKEYTGWTSVGARVVYVSPRSNVDCYTLLEACCVSCDFGGGLFAFAAPSYMFGVEQYDLYRPPEDNLADPVDRHRIVMRGDSLRVNGQSTAYPDAGWFGLQDVVGFSGSAVRALDVEQCIFSSEADTLYLVSSYSFSQSFLPVATRFRNNWHHNIRDGRYARAVNPGIDRAVAAGYDDSREWRVQTFADGDGITWDGNGVYGLDPAYSDAAGGDLSPAAGGPLAMLHGKISYEQGPAGMVGVNGLPYCRRFGAFQDGSPADLDSDASVGSVDLAILLGAWGQPGGAADLTGDGAVNSADLALLLGAWGPCQ